MVRHDLQHQHPIRDCLQTLKREAGDITYETLLVDNASRDGSADMQQEFLVRLVRSPVNLGFAAPAIIAPFT